MQVHGAMVRHVAELPGALFVGITEDRQVGAERFARVFEEPIAALLKAHEEGVQVLVDDGSARGNVRHDAPDSIRRRFEPDAVGLIAALVGEHEGRRWHHRASVDSALLQGLAALVTARARRHVRCGQEIEEEEQAFGAVRSSQEPGKVRRKREPEVRLQHRKLGRCCARRERDFVDHGELGEGARLREEAIELLIEFVKRSWHGRAIKPARSPLR